MDSGLLAQFLIVTLIQLAFNLVIGGLIAWFLGRSRVIGFGWSLFFCCSTSFIFGFIITMLSPKYANANLTTSKTRKIIGWILLVLGVFSIYAIGQAFYTGQGIENAGGASIGLIIAMIGGGIYLIKRSRGVSFHSPEKGLSDDATSA